MNIWKWLVGRFTGKPSQTLEEELDRKYFTPLVMWDEPQQAYVAVLGLFNVPGHGDTEEAAIEDMYAKMDEAIRTAPRGIAGGDISGPAGMAGGDISGTPMCEWEDLRAEQSKAAFLFGGGKRSLSSMTGAERIEYANANFHVHCGMGAKDHFVITKWFAERGFNVWGDK